MNTPDRCRYISTELQRLIRKVFNYCSLLLLVSVFAMSSWSIQSASAQTASGTLELAGPAGSDPSPDEEFGVSVEIKNPQNVYVFQIALEYPGTLELSDENPIVPGKNQLGEDQFPLRHLSIGNEDPIGEGRVLRQLNLLNNTDFISAGTLFTINFETAEIGNYLISITARDRYTRLQNQRAEGDPISENALPSLDVAVRGPLQATVNLVPPIGTVRVGEATFIDIELKDRSRAHSYEITVDPSANLGPLTVSYNADDMNTTAITNHTAGDPITISANSWIPNDPLDNIIDWRVTHSDIIVATLLFTPTTAGEGSITITAAKIRDIDTTELILSNPDTLTFTIASPKTNVVYRDTGVGPTPIIEVDDGVKDGPFEIEISFASENYIEQQHQRLKNGVVVEVLATFLFQRGVYGFKRDEIEIGGDAGASVTTRLWEADGAELYYARINPTETGAREVTIQIQAGVVQEVGTDLLNVASETVTVRTNLEYPPWDVDEDGRVNADDAEYVKAALGLGLEARGNFAAYVNTINSHQRDINNDTAVNQEDLYLARRSDVNGDLYVNQVDLDLVREHIPVEEGGMQGRSLETRQARGAETPPDVSVWMPDAKLRQCVRKKLNLADDTDLTQTEMTNLSKLSCRKKGISDITGLEYATNLKSLDILGNDIIDLTALEGLTSLTYLNIKENQISDIAPLGNLTKLRELWMTDNTVEDISPLSNLVELRVLRMSGNPVLDLSPLYLLIRGKLRWYGGLDVPQYPPWDVNEDGSVDATDSALVTAALGQSGDDIADPRTDVNGDGTVDQDDLTLVTDNLDTDGGAPSIVALLAQGTLETLDRETLATYLNILRAESDGSSKYQQAIAMLEALLATTLPPKQTRLLANYPNPFNPETWIPYQLASASSVQIIIYDTSGTVVRRLDLGHQPEGYYTTRSRAAHWDGRNGFGERVASGIYFYQLQADNISSLRKLLILK